MVTAAPELSHVLVKTDRGIGPRTKHNKTLFRQCLGHAKMHCPKPQMSTEELSLELVKLGLKPLRSTTFNVIA